MVSIVTRKRFWFAAVFGMIVLFYTIKQANLQKFVEHLGDISPLWAVAVLACSSVSYACIAGVLQRLLKGIGLPLSFSSCFKISLLSCTLNYLMSVGAGAGWRQRSTCSRARTFLRAILFFRIDYPRFSDQHDSGPVHLPRIFLPLQPAPDNRSQPGSIRRPGPVDCLCDDLAHDSDDHP